MMRWADRSARAAAMLVAVVVLVLSSSAAAWAIDPPAPPVLFPDDPTLQQAYEDGFTTGYSVGSDDGFADGRRGSTDQSGLRDEAAKQAEQAPVQEGGRDLGDQITPSPTPTPSPSATPEASTTDSSTTYDEPPQQAGGVPWWPLAFAVAVTAWFVTRRRRRDSAQD